jgi:hypothetical protein
VRGKRAIHASQKRDASRLAQIRQRQKQPPQDDKYK